MRLASRGLRDLDKGPEPLEPEAVEPVRRQARGVHLRAAALAAGLTLLVLVL